MSDTTNIANISTQQPSAVTGAGKSSASLKVTTGPAVAVPAPIFNTRIISDPIAGQITQYLDSNGENVVTQTPAAAVVAYLHQGLNENGQPDGTSLPPDKKTIVSA